MPFFTVIIPTYNRAEFIAKAVQSVFDQTFGDFELIIVDDASTDNTAEIMASFLDSRLKYIKNEQNIERCRSRNKGIGLAQGKYICFLDSDDYHLPNHLETLYNEIEKRNQPEALFFTNAWDSPDGISLNERTCPPLQNYSVFDYIATFTFNPQRMCIHKNIFKRFLFDPEVYVCEDLDLAARIATCFQVIQVPERTTVYVHHSGSFTSGDSQKPFKELENYNRIFFQKPELHQRFSKATIRRLRSMCYFHISFYYEKQRQLWKMYKAILKSMVLFPQGYNKKTNKILWVAVLYNLPLLGFFIKYVVKKIKQWT